MQSNYCMCETKAIYVHTPDLINNKGFCSSVQNNRGERPKKRLRVHVIFQTQEHKKRQK